MCVCVCNMCIYEVYLNAHAYNTHACSGMHDFTANYMLTLMWRVCVMKAMLT